MKKRALFIISLGLLLGLIVWLTRIPGIQREPSLDRHSSPALPQKLFLDVSHITKPFDKVEPLPSVHLGASYEGVKKLLDSHGIAYDTGKDPPKGNSDNGWYMSFEILGDYPSDVGPNQVRVLMDFPGGRLDFMLIHNSFEIVDVGMRDRLRAVGDAIVASIGAPEIGDQPVTAGDKFKSALWNDDNGNYMVVDWDPHQYQHPSYAAINIQISKWQGG